mmetsp:Transcript_18429/g.37424  ORF Transcript_18429/g.37424 Transcript_18429/m.37424 type:complete len:344 (+) Transcript_18429:133-1164(+)
MIRFSATPHSIASTHTLTLISVAKLSFHHVERWPIRRRGKKKPRCPENHEISTSLGSIPSAVRIGTSWRWLDSMLRRTSMLRRARSILRRTASVSAAGAVPWAWTRESSTLRRVVSRLRRTVSAERRPWSAACFLRLTSSCVSASRRAARARSSTSAWAKMVAREGPRSRPSRRVAVLRSVWALAMKGASAWSSACALLITASARSPPLPQLMLSSRSSTSCPSIRPGCHRSTSSCAVLSLSAASSVCTISSCRRLQLRRSSRLLSASGRASVVSLMTMSVMTWWLLLPGSRGSCHSVSQNACIAAGRECCTRRSNTTKSSSCSAVNRHDCCPGRPQLLQVTM